MKLSMLWRALMLPVFIPVLLCELFLGWVDDNARTWYESVRNTRQKFLGWLDAKFPVK